MKKIGLVIVMIGLIVTLFTGFNYITREKVVDIGTLQINKSKNHYVAWSPIVGIVLLVVGCTTILLGNKKLS